MRPSHVEEQPLPATDMPVDQMPDVPPEQPGIQRRPSRWLALAFVAMLSALVLIGTTDIGAAASTLFSDPTGGCGGP